jgi:hypothetical protein
MAFATPQELSAYTTGLISPDDDRSELVLAGASKAIQNYCGWNIAPPEDITVFLDGGTEELFLPTLKLNAVTSVSVAGVQADLADFEWSRRTGNIRRRTHSAFPEVYGDIVVVFNSGYAAVPEDLKQIVLQVSAMALSSPTGATREQAGQVSMQWATTAPGVSGGLTLLDRDFLTLSAYLLPKEV